MRKKTLLSTEAKQPKGLKKYGWVEDSEKNKSENEQLKRYSQHVGINREKAKAKKAKKNAKK